jgi:hypothetical protein
MVFGHLVMVGRSFNTGIESQVREDFETIQDVLAHQVGDDDGIRALDDQGQGHVGANTGHGHEKDDQQCNPQRFSGTDAKWMKQGEMAWD